MSNKLLTDDQLRAAAKKIGIRASALKAIVEIEARSNGFQPNGEPTILFERHKFYEGLIKIKWITKAKEWYKLYPNICNPKSGGYGKYSAQHGRLQQAAALNRTVALESASWGLGQVMGFNWASLQYKSLQEFINAMYESEEKQLEAMTRFLVINNLIKPINDKNWVRVAEVYNGPRHYVNNYAPRLAAAEAKWAKRGF